MICYLDMDGVIVNFIDAFLEKFNSSLKKVIERHGLPAPVDIGEMLDVTPEQEKEIYDSWEAADWIGLRKLPWADELIDYLDQVFGNDNILFCTSAGIAPTKFYYEAVVGKVEWISRNLDNRYKYHVLISNDKSRYASDYALLIDDQERNCEAFIRAGGSAILFPSPFNKKYGYLKYDDSRPLYEESKEDVLNHIKEEIRAIVKAKNNGDPLNEFRAFRD